MLTDDILKWVETLPKWQQKLSYQILQEKSISEKILDEIYILFKMEMKLEDGEMEADVIQFGTVGVDKRPNVIWKGVKNLHGVNKLKSDTELSVSEGLTVIYGENGSGKSGYTRLLNNAFISRGDQEILPNIFADRVEDVSANFSFCVDGEFVEYRYPDNKEEYPFKTIRNFDSKSASEDMNKESKIDFAPSELSFFDQMLSGCLEIQKKLDVERECKKRDNPTLKFFPNEGKALNSMQLLSEKTIVEDIKKEFLVTKEEQDKYEQLKKERVSLEALNINRQFFVISKVLEFLENAEKKYELFKVAVSDMKIDAYNQQICSLKRNRVVHEKDGIALFKNDDIEKLGTEEWQNFISAAKKYYDEINKHDRCPLCGHEISEKDLIFKYWKYLESDAENNYNVAKEAICTSKKELSGLDLSFLVESSIQEQWLMENFRTETESVSAIFEMADSVRKKVFDSLENEKEIREKVVILNPDISGLITKVKEKQSGLNQVSINERIAECTRMENEYIDKTKVIDILSIIESYVKYLKWDALAGKCKIKTRNITNKQKELFEKYVTDDYLRTFEEECRKLNANFDINIVSRGSSGRTLKKLQIKGKVPGKVLSEGEQRAISIANFLTEVKMDDRNIGIVFDDPVCSLDHKRRSKIANRLVEEAKTRQVIIFTHEITFFMELKTEAERSGITFRQETIRKVCGEPGNISPVISWQGMNVKERTGKLKNDLQKIVAVFNSGNMDDYYYRAKEWCELLRESWERAVEEILFNDAIQRYNPCVQTQRLKKAPFTRDSYIELERGMSECSAWCHDQARAINVDVPSVDDLKLYIECFEKYCKTYKVK